MVQRLQGRYTPGKFGKIRELQIGRGTVGEILRIMEKSGKTGK